MHSSIDAMHHVAMSKFWSSLQAATQRPHRRCVGTRSAFDACTASTVEIKIRGTCECCQHVASGGFLV